MKMPIGNAPQVVGEFFQSVLLPAAQKAGGMTPFLVGFVGGAVSRNATQLLEQCAPLGKALGLIDADNMVDVDLLHDCAVEALEKSPLVVAGYRPDQEDLDKLRDIMSKYGG